jgi:hypothetical protein
MIAQKGKERHRRGSDSQIYRDLNIFKGTVTQALKLARANIEEITSQNKTKPTDDNKEGIENVPGRQESHVRTSDIYLAIQPSALEDATNGSVVEGDATSFYFVVYLSDPNNNIEFSTVSQPLPLEWSEWLEAPDDEFVNFEADPRDWIIDWLEESMSIAVGVVAQRYVIARMGVHKLLAMSSKAEVAPEKPTSNG